ncbi:unannotated protein [freshwater metagenome]|uniref:Unannotated protein n=1 Tax=freshwater metagenome TaxID=449393 RepID=A0A6J6LKB0_9ZZZZ
MMSVLQAAFNRVFGREVLLRGDTPLSSLGTWNEYAVYIATALHESTGAIFTDEELSSVTTVGDLLMVLEKSAV